MDSFQFHFLQAINTPATIAGLFAAAVILVAIDYFFLVDWPAHTGYLAFACGLFLVLPMTVFGSALVAGAALMMLEILHAVLFGRFLTNAPGRLQEAPAHNSTNIDLDA